MFETRLLIIITAVTLLVTACAIALSWFVNRRLRGAHYWSLGYFSLAGGVVMQSLQGNLTPVLSIGLANLLICCGVYLTYIGVSQYQGRSLRQRYGLLWVALVVILVHAAVGLGREGFAARTLLISGGIGIIAFMTSYRFFKSEQRGNRLAYRFNVVVYFLFGSAFMVRALSIFFVPLQTSAIDNTPFSQATYLGATVFNILIAFSYLFTLYGSHGMVVQRLADTDMLTGLFNRRGVGKHTDLLLKRMQGLGGNVSALFFRLRPGLLAEQEEKRLLQGFAEKLLRSFQPDDLLARIGEHEFVVVVANVEQARLAAAADHLQQVIQRTGVDNGVGVICSEVEYVLIEAVRATTGFDELWQRAERLWAFRNTATPAGSLAAAAATD